MDGSHASHSLSIHIDLEWLLFFQPLLSVAETEIQWPFRTMQPSGAQPHIVQSRIQSSCPLEQI